MKKQHRLLSLLLVIILLSGAFLFSVNADSAATLDSGGDFSPTATVTVENPTNLSVVKDANSSNLVTGIGFTNQYKIDNVLQKDYFDYRKVTPENGNAFYSVSPNLTTSPSNNYVSVNTASNTVVSPANNSHFVVDLDVATVSEYIDNYSLVILNRSSKNGNTVFGDSNGVAIKDYVPVSDSWAHFTLVGSYSSNTQYIFVNGVCVGTQSSAYNSGNWDNSLSFTLNGIRINMAGQMAFDTTDSMLFDNLSIRHFDNTTGTDIANYLSVGSDLGSWSGNLTGRSGEKLPASAIINGKTYYNEGDVTKLLAKDYADADPKEISLLRENILVESTSGYIVNTFCKLTDNGISYTLGDDVVASGEYFIYKALENTNTSETLANNATTLKNSIIYSGTDKSDTKNQFTSVQFSSDTAAGSAGWGDVGARQSHVVTNPISGDEFYKESANGSIGYSGEYITAAEYEALTTADKSTLYKAKTVNGETVYEKFFDNEYINYVSNITLTYNESTRQYVVYDFDFAYTGTLDSSISFSIVPRKSGSGRWGTGTQFSTLGLTAGDVVHFTLIADFYSAKSFLFINGEYVKTITNGAINTAGHTEYLAKTPITANELKFGSNSNATYFIDNMYIRLFEEDASQFTSSSLNAAVAGCSIKSWSNNVYNSDYVMPCFFPVLGTVDGKYFGSVDAMNNALLYNPAAEVTILKNLGSISTYSYATFNTNGLASITASEGCSIEYSDALIVKTFMQNRSESNIQHSTIGDMVGYPHKDNLFYINTGLSNNINAANGRGTYLVTDTHTGNTYVNERTYSGTVTGTSNTYLGWCMGNVNYVTGTNQYIILDADFAVHDRLTYQINPITRRNGSGVWHNAAVDLKTVMADIPLGQFAHVTIVLSPDTTEATVFVNGIFKMTVEKAIITTDYSADEMYFSDFRCGPNSQADVSYANVCMRTVNDATLTTAITNKNIKSWSDNIYDNSYVLPSAPAVANVNGIYCYSQNDVDRATNVRGDVTVDILHTLENPITVGVTGKVLTHGLSTKDDFSDLFTLGENTTVKSISSTIVYLEGPYVKSALTTPLNPDPANSLSLTAPEMKDKDSDNLVERFQIVNNLADDGVNNILNYYDMLASGEFDSYYAITPNVSYTGGKNPYLSVGIISDNALAGISTSSYYVFDMDVATESDVISALTLEVKNRGKLYDTNKSTDYASDCAGVNLGSFISPSDSWAHITVVGDYAANVQYVFVNGEYVGTAGKVLSNEGKECNGTDLSLSNQVTNGDFRLREIRLNIGGHTSLDLNSSILFDSISLRMYSSDSAAGNISSYLKAGADLSGWANYISGRTGDKLPALVSVNGTSYGNVHTANAALTSASKIDVNMEKDALSALVSINAPSTVDAHGITFSLAPGFIVESITDDVWVIKAHDGVYLVTLKIGNTVIVENLEVKAGTPVADAFYSVYEKAPYNLNGKLVLAGKALYANVEWNYGTEWDSDRIYSDGTWAASSYEQLDFVVHDGNAIDSSIKDFSTFITKDAERYLILGSDLSTYCAGSFNAAANKSVYLNGNTLNFLGENLSGSATVKDENGKDVEIGVNAGGTRNGEHSTSVSSTGSGNFGFYGPGVISDTNAFNTQAFFFAAYNWTGTMTLKDLTFNASQALAQLRSGNLVIDGCEVNAYSAYDTPLFQIGEDYNGNYTKNAINITFKDSYVSFRHNSDSIVPMIRQRIVSSGGASDPNHVLTITGSTIIAQSAFLEAGRAIGDVPTNASNLTVNVDNSSIIARQLVLYCVSNGQVGYGAQINFVDNVYVTEPMLAHKQTCLAGDNRSTLVANTDGLILVKSNNHLAPVCYSKSYATVTWEDNSVEYWVAGSTPVKAGKFNKVGVVSAGQNVSFHDCYESAPFSLKGNLTLGSEIAFNLYTTKGVVSFVTVNGNKISATERIINGVAYDCFTVRLTPTEAVSAFDVIFTLSDGNSVARTLSVAAYASSVYADSPTSSAIDIVSATLNYIKAAATYFGINADLSAINKLLDKYPVMSADIPTSVTKENADENILNYFTGAQLDILDTLKIRFNRVAGVDLSSLIITVNGEARDYVLTDLYVELSLRAYEMSDLITISVGGIKYDYCLAEYFIGALELSEKAEYYYIKNGDGTYTYDLRTTADARRYAALFNVNKGNFANAMYVYTIAARAYNPVL